MKKGDNIYVVSDDTRYKPFVATIISIGRKRIKISDSHESCAYFDVVTKRSLDDYRGWNCGRTIYASKAEYEQRMLEAAEHKSLFLEVRAKLQHATIENLKVINDILK